MRNVLFASVLLIAGAAAAQTPTQAETPAPLETSRVFGAYEVFYNVFPSTMLSADVAGTYRIVRGKDRAVINIAVRKHLDSNSDTAQTAQVSGTSSDLMQSKTLEFREIKEQDAVYYIADLRHTDGEFLRFDIKVQPEPGAPPYALTFTRKLYYEP